VILSLTDDRRIEAILRFIGELPEEARPVGAVVPVVRTFGLRSRGPEAEGP
jgi:hypothetical protein